MAGRKPSPLSDALNALITPNNSSNLDNTQGNSGEHVDKKQKLDNNNPDNPDNRDTDVIMTVNNPNNPTNASHVENNPLNLPTSPDDIKAIDSVQASSQHTFPLSPQNDDKALKSQNSQVEMAGKPSGYTSNNKESDYSLAEGKAKESANNPDNPDNLDKPVLGAHEVQPRQGDGEMVVSDGKSTEQNESQSNQSNVLSTDNPDSPDSPDSLVEVTQAELSRRMIKVTLVTLIISWDNPDNPGNPGNPRWFRPRRTDDCYCL